MNIRSTIWALVFGLWIAAIVSVGLLMTSDGWFCPDPESTPRSDCR